MAIDRNEFLQNWDWKEYYSKCKSWTQGDLITKNVLNKYEKQLLSLSDGTAEIEDGMLNKLIIASTTRPQEKYNKIWIETTQQPQPITVPTYDDMVNKINQLIEQNNKGYVIDKISEKIRFSDLAFELGSINASGGYINTDLTIARSIDYIPGTGQDIQINPNVAVFPNKYFYITNICYWRKKPNTNIMNFVGKKDLADGTRSVHIYKYVKGTDATANIDNIVDEIPQGENENNYYPLRAKLLITVDKTNTISQDDLNLLMKNTYTNDIRQLNAEYNWCSQQIYDLPDIYATKETLNSNISELSNSVSGLSDIVSDLSSNTVLNYLSQNGNYTSLISLISNANSLIYLVEHPQSSANLNTITQEIDNIINTATSSEASQAIIESNNLVKLYSQAKQINGLVENKEQIDDLVEKKAQIEGLLGDTNIIPKELQVRSSFQLKDNNNNNIDLNLSYDIEHDNYILNIPESFNTNSFTNAQNIHLSMNITDEVRDVIQNNTNYIIYITNNQPIDQQNSVHVKWNKIYGFITQKDTPPYQTYPAISSSLRTKTSFSIQNTMYTDEQYRINLSSIKDKGEYQYELFRTNLMDPNKSFYITLTARLAVDTTFVPTQLTASIKIIKETSYITCWGDSLTGRPSPKNWPSYLQDILDVQKKPVSVYNGGTGGETSMTIAARQGADTIFIPPIIDSGTTYKAIPAYSSEGQNGYLELKTNDQTIFKSFSGEDIKIYGGIKPNGTISPKQHLKSCLIAGAECDIVATGDGTSASDRKIIIYQTSSSTKKHEAIQLNHYIPVYTGYDLYKNSPLLMTMLMGGNEDKNYNKYALNSSYDYQTNTGMTGENYVKQCVQELIQRFKKMIQHSNAKNYLVLGFSSRSREERQIYQTMMHMTFGPKFLSLRQYLSTPLYGGPTIQSPNEPYRLIPSSANEKPTSCYGMRDQGTNLAYYQDLSAHENNKGGANQSANSNNITHDPFSTTNRNNGEYYKFDHGVNEDNLKWQLTNFYEEMANGQVPKAILYDGGHYTAATNKVIANLIYKYCRDTLKIF